MGDLPGTISFPSVPKVHHQAKGCEIRQVPMVEWPLGVATEFGAVTGDEFQARTVSLGVSASEAHHLLMACVTQGLPMGFIETLPPVTDTISEMRTLDGIQVSLAMVWGCLLKTNLDVGIFSYQIESMSNYFFVPKKCCQISISCLEHVCPNLILVLRYNYISRNKYSLIRIMKKLQIRL